MKPKQKPAVNATEIKLAPDPANPNRMDPEDKARMVKSLAEFGDLSGVTLNRRTGLLIGGHQRVDVMTGATIETEDLSKPEPDGTVARGHLIHNGRRYALRVVDWPEDKARAALLAANRFARVGKDDAAILKDLLEMLDDGSRDMDLTGYSAEERERLALQYFVSEEEKAGKAIAEQVASEKEWQAQHDGADKRAEKIKERIDALQKKSPDALQKGKLVIISPDAAEAIVLIDDSLKDVIDELMRYAENGTASPLAALMEARHPL
jgi:hypothetical protein